MFVGNIRRMRSKSNVTADTKATEEAHLAEENVKGSKALGRSGGKTRRRSSVGALLLPKLDSSAGKSF